MINEIARGFTRDEWLPCASLGLYAQRPRLTLVRLSLGMYFARCTHSVGPCADVLDMANIRNNFLSFFAGLLLRGRTSASTFDKQDFEASAIRLAGWFVAHLPIYHKEFCNVTWPSSRVACHRDYNAHCPYGWRGGVHEAGRLDFVLKCGITPDVFLRRCVLHGAVHVCFLFRPDEGAGSLRRGASF